VQVNADSGLIAGQCSN